MPNTYTQIHIQSVFAVKYRAALIYPSWEDRLYRYITGIVQKHGHKLLAINGMPDHIHLFFGMRPVQSLSDLVREIKGDSSEWVNKERLAAGLFRWQEGFGAFSYRKKDIPVVCRYIANQKEHHRKVEFFEEYKLLLEEFDVQFDNRYVFHAPQ
ncbi:MAG: IS200/IS605 family transposase [Chitinophagaceae bacterium]